MKKYVAAMVPLAALMSIGTASAQSAVTLFGIVDTGVSGYWNQAQGPLGITITTSQTMLTNSAYQTSRLGFKGTEDLGPDDRDANGEDKDWELKAACSSTAARPSASRATSVRSAWGATTPRPTGTTTSSIPSA